MKLDNKVIVITGGNGLIGTEIIKYLNQEGAITINADINFDNQDFNNTEFKCDITNLESINKLIYFVIKEYGRIDGWVNNAYPRTDDWGNRFENIIIDSWKTNIDYQLNSLFLCCQTVLEIMKKQKSGSIVNIASIYGVVGPDFTVYEGTDITMPAAYSAIKGASINFTRYLASYYGPYGIRVNCVSPGGILNNQDPIFIKKYEEKVPLKRMGTPSDIAPAVGFLLSDESSYITGHNLMIDGGWTAI
jgi:NAD(P)-dependent dehydrogenase (short-subunit alcohol dehydrogenase family)